MTLVSRVGSVNLSNMPAVSEAPLPEAKSEADPWLAGKTNSLADPAEWKVTKFETTPLVREAGVPFVGALRLTAGVVLGLHVPCRVRERAVRIFGELVHEPLEWQGPTTPHLRYVSGLRGALLMR